MKDLSSGSGGQVLTQKIPFVTQSSVFKLVEEQTCAVVPPRVKLEHHRQMPAVCGVHFCSVS